MSTQWLLASFFIIYKKKPCDQKKNNKLLFYICTVFVWILKLRLIDKYANSKYWKSGCCGSCGRRLLCHLNSSEIYYILYIIYLVIWIDILRINYMLYLYIYMISSSSKLSDQTMIMMPFTFLYQYIIIFKLTQTAHLLSLLHCTLLHFCI